MKNLKLGILLMVLCTLFTATGQLFFKYSSTSFEWNIFSMITNHNLILGFIFYAFGAGMLIAALRFGNLSLIYPFVALTFVWVMFISGWILKENINNLKIGAAVFIIFGIVLVAGSNNGK